MLPLALAPLELELELALGVPLVVLDVVVETPDELELDVLGVPDVVELDEELLDVVLGVPLEVVPPPGVPLLESSQAAKTKTDPRPIARARPIQRSVSFIYFSICY